MNRNTVKNRKKYLVDVYAKYWQNAREEKYGFSQYDKNCIKLITKHTVRNSRFLDVEIGTGYPFASELNKYNEISGIDISPLLIEKCKSLYPSINCQVGDVENLPFTDKSFDLVYSFHSTWYFCDLNRAISEMIRVSKVGSGGSVIFDIQNINNKDICQSYNKRKKKYKWRYFYYPVHIIKQIMKKYLRYPHSSFLIVNHEHPSSPEDLIKFIDSKNIRYKIFYRDKNNLFRADNIEQCKKNARLVFFLE